LGDVEEFHLTLKDSAMSDSHVFYSEEDGGYIADILDLKSCSAVSHTAEEAFREVQIAKAAWLRGDSARCSGCTRY